MNRCKTMVISMELAVPLSFCAASRITTCTYSSSRVFIFGRGKLYGRWKYILKPIRFCLSWEKDSSLNRYNGRESEVDCGEFGGDSEFVEVIGIGSRKDAVLDFCLDSPFHSSSLRFWNILMKDTMKVQLQQRFIGKDFSPRILEAPLSLHSCSKAIILVVSAGYGLDHITAIEIIRTIRSLQGFAIAIVLNPFSFEGQRRQNEVRDLVEKLQEHTNFCIDIDTDTLLREDLVTLDEALKTANNAVLFAINAIAVLVSDAHRKFIDVPHNNMKELKFPELIKILESYKEAKIGFGAGYNIKTSIAQAIYDCPFLSVGVKDLNGIVVCILASSGDIDNSDVHAFLHSFRQTTEYMKEIIISIIHEPNLESNLLVTTVIILGSCSGQPPSQKWSILSRLTEHFPFVFNLLWRHYRQLEDSQGNHSVENPRLSKVANSLDSIEAQNRIPVDHVDEGINMYSEELQTVLSSSRDEIYALRHYDSVYGECEFGFSEAESSNFCDSNSEGTPAFQREPLISWNLGPGYQIAQEWAKERADNSGPTSMHDNLSIFHLPVGVRPSEELKDSPNISNIAQHSKPKIKDDFKTQPLVTPSMSSWDALTDAGFEAVMDLYSSASTLLKGKYADAPKKQGVLSVRAASMLEAERDATKKWSPIVEMQYRGGVYRGRCQGGLPEGKGCLTLGDASIYDGMWRYGKRSGLGTFYFSNGDVFQGSWRDDVMHGKGWFYFHTGDRWFANFWKGKANGEGRFYSKFGDIFFGHFRDGWRHGNFLCINVDGERFVEIWDDGVLVSCEQLDCDTGAG